MGGEGADVPQSTSQGGGGGIFLNLFLSFDLQECRFYRRYYELVSKFSSD